MIIFSHRGMGFGKKENSFEAICSVVKNVFSVELDLRLRNNNIVLSHDEVKDSKDVSEFNGLLKLMKENSHLFFALHLKDDLQALFQIVGYSIQPFKNCFLFITDFKQDNFITNMCEIIGKEHLALYVTDKDLDLNLVNKVDYLWLDETKSDIYDHLGYFIGFNKKIICCSPEIFTKDYNKRLEYLQNKILDTDIFGICTDWPEYYKAIK